ncbi:MAG TPA: hypothetical protein VKD90_02875 [Gemmataceae bacterium]|nr:hypothetical protein [Gemmataceae bacterium]
MPHRPFASSGCLICTVSGLFLGGGVGTAQGPPVAAKPATLGEVRRAIDWSKFPRPAGATWEETDLFRTAYFAPGKPDAVADFLCKAMLAEGWTEAKRPFPDTEPDKYRSISFGKDGQLVEAFLEAKTDTVKVSLSSRGNPDAPRLPRPADAKVTAEHRTGVHYTTAGKPEAVAEFCRKEFVGRGWRFVSTVAFAEEGTVNLRFVQAAMGVDMRATKNAAGGANVGYFALLRSEFDPTDVATEFAPGPAPKPLTRAEALRLIDLRKVPRLGEKKPRVDTGLRLQYEAAGVNAGRAASFYRKHLAEAGWTLTLPVAETSDTAHLRFEKEGSLLGLDLREESRPTSLVRVTLENHGNVDLRRLPYPPGSEIGWDRRPLPVMVHTAAKPPDVTAFYRAELPKLGWAEKGKDLEFVQGGMRVKVYVGTPKGGPTPVQVGAGFRDE